MGNVVDMSYPNELHDLHNDLPFLPENKIPPGSKVKNLWRHFIQKKKKLSKHSVR